MDTDVQSASRQPIAVHDSCGVGAVGGGSGGGVGCGTGVCCHSTVSKTDIESREASTQYDDADDACTNKTGRIAKIDDSN